MISLKNNAMPIRKKRFARRPRFHRRKRFTRRPKIALWKRKYGPANRKLTTTLIRQPSGLADRTYVKLRLNIDLAQTNTAGLMSTLIIKTNDLFDCMGSAGSLQPYLFDQWSTLYSNYIVHGFKWRIQSFFGATGISSTSVRRVTVTPTNSSSAHSNIENALNQPYAKSNTFQVNAGNSRMLKGYFKIPHLLGLSKAQYLTAPYSFGAQVGSSPSSPTYIHFITDWPFTNATDVTTNSTIYLTFYAMFFNRTIPVNS